MKHEHEGLGIPALPNYSGWTEYTPVIPKMYWDVYSAEQRMKMLCVSNDKIVHFLDSLAASVEKWGKEFAGDLETNIDDMWEAVESGYKDEAVKWFEKYANDYFEHWFRYCWFGLTSDGYMIAYVADGMEGIEFDTGRDYCKDTYGRLILRWDMDSPYRVSQLPEKNQLGTISNDIDDCKE